MKTKLLFAGIGAVLLAAAVSILVYVNNEKNSMSEIFNANVEALTRTESSTSCYRTGDGPRVFGIFCHPYTQPPVIYGCTSPYTDRMGGISSCY